MDRVNNKMSQLERENNDLRLYAYNLHKTLQEVIQEQKSASNDYLVCNEKNRRKK